MSMKFLRAAAFVTPFSAALSFGGNVFAQTKNDFLLGASTVSAGKGGTSSSLPDAGSTDITYFLFVGGLTLFVLGTLKLILSYRD